MIIQMVVVRHLTFPITFFPLKVVTLAHLQTSSMTTLLMMTTMIGAKAL